MFEEKNILDKVFEENFTLLTEEERKEFVFECLLDDEFSIAMNTFSLKNRMNMAIIRICREYVQVEKIMFSEDEFYNRLYCLKEKEIAYFSSIGLVFPRKDETHYRGRDASKDFMNCVKQLGYSPEEFSKEIKAYQKKQMKKRIDKKIDSIR
ncbi:TPA: hypothetical protein ACF0SI_002818 [Enterococcus hirae]